MEKFKDKDFLPLHLSSSNSRLALFRRNSLAKYSVAFIAFFFLYLVFRSGSGTSTGNVETTLTENPQQDDEVFDTTWNERSNWRRTIPNMPASYFKPENFTPEALESNHLIPVTAVLLAWKRPEGLKAVIQKLIRHPFIKEIIIWNNNKDTKVHLKDFALSPLLSDHVEIHIFNQDENLHDLAKYTSCSMAKYDYCYFQDDDWLNGYLDSLYINFLRHPQLIHSNTMPIIHLEHRRWQFSNIDISMHAGFTWLGCGSFIPRLKVQRFLAQLGHANLGKDRLRLADMYFSIWTNQYPYQLGNPLIPLDQKEGWSESDGVDQWAIVYQNTYDAASRLHGALVANSEMTKHDFFEREELEPRPEDRDVRAPCLNDKCLFATSIDPFPNPSLVPFDNDTIPNIKILEGKFNKIRFPTNAFWVKHAYHYAVDGDPTTCWNSFKSPEEQDYFGLYFVEPIRATRLTIISSKSIEIMKKKSGFTILSTVDNEDWLPCKVTDKKIVTPENVITLGVLCASGKPVTGLRWQFEKMPNEPFELCQIEVNDFVV